MSAIHADYAAKIKRYEAARRAYDLGEIFDEVLISKKSDLHGIPPEVWAAARKVEENGRGNISALAQFPPMFARPAEGGGYTPVFGPPDFHDGLSSAFRAALGFMFRTPGGGAVPIPVRVVSDRYRPVPRPAKNVIDLRRLCPARGSYERFAWLFGQSDARGFLRKARREMQDEAKHAEREAAAAMAAPKADPAPPASPEGVKKPARGRPEPQLEAAIGGATRGAAPVTADQETW
jgi:hypothetical protein